MHLQYKVEADFTGLSSSAYSSLLETAEAQINEAQRMGVWSMQAGVYLPAISIEQAAVIYDWLESTGYAAKISSSALIASTDINLVVFYAKPEGFKTGGSFDTTPFGDLPVLSGVNLHGEVSAFTDSLSLQATLLLNPADSSALLKASLGSGFVENCTISLEGTWFLGPDASEFGSMRIGPTGLWGTVQLFVEVGY